MAPESRGGLHLGIDPLGEPAVRLEKGPGAHAHGALEHEVRVPGVPSLLDPIVMSRDGTHHAGGREV